MKTLKTFRGARGFALLLALCIGLLAACGGAPAGGATSEATAATTAAAAATTAAEAATDAAAATTEAAATTAAAAAGEVVDCRIVIPGALPTDQPKVQEEINALLAADGVGVQYNVTNIEWDVWDQKVNIMLTSGEAFDLFHIMQDVKPYASYIAQGGIQEIGQYIDAHGPNLKANIPENMWAATSQSGKIYAIPAFWMELATNGIMQWRGDLFGEYGIGEPTTPQEIIDFSEELNTKRVADGKPALTFPLIGASADPSRTGSYTLHRSYDSYPFTPFSKLFLIREDGKVESWTDSEEFKMDSAWFRQAYEKGIIDPDVLVMKSEVLNQMYDEGDYLFKFGTVGSRVELALAKYPEITDADMTNIWINPEKAKFRDISVKNCNGVPVTSQHPEAAVKFLDWVYENDEHYNMFFYGIEGEHYERTGERTIVPVMGPNGTSLYSASDWMFGNLNYIKYSDASFTATTSALYNTIPDAVNGIASSFFFSPDAVSAEYSNLMTIYDADAVPIYIGVMDYDENIENVKTKMKDAGIDAVIAECQRQLDEYLANR